MLALFPVALGGLTPAQAAGTTYYVDCTGGNDGNSGTQASAAWQSLGRANAATLLPGDSLLFKRGCTWTGSLTLKWSGTAAAPILISAYGSGPLPAIKNGHEQIAVTGSYAIIDSLAVTADAFGYDSGCNNAPTGYLTGVRFLAGATYDIFRNSTAISLEYGATTETGANHIKILNNVFQNNNVKDPSPASDSGGVAIALSGDDNEVAFNSISGSDMCSERNGRDGSAIEVYGGHRNTMHHNSAIDNNNFTELGKAGTSDNTYAYNIVRSSGTTANFLVTRGVGDTTFGPIYRTKMYNNSVYLSGAQSYAIQCTYGCGPDILTFKNNIVWAEDRIGFADAAFDEGYNIYWKSTGAPTTVWFPISASSREINPQWVSLSDFHLQATSPAINAGTMESVNAGFTADMDNNPVPQGAGVDIGAYEFTGATTGNPLLHNSSFETGGSSWADWWPFWVRPGAAATFSRDSSTATDGSYSAQINVTQSSTQDWLAQLQQTNVPLVGGHTYSLTFSAKTSASHSISVGLQQSNAPYMVYGFQAVSLGTQWQKYTITIPVSVSDPNAAVEFNCAGATGQVWIDNVSLIQQ